MSAPADLVKNVEPDYSERCPVGLLFGPRLSVEAMKAWVRDCWNVVRVEVELIQALANGYYIFLFKQANMALKILGSSQWMYRRIVPSAFSSVVKTLQP